MSAPPFARYARPPLDATLGLPRLPDPEPIEIPAPGGLVVESTVSEIIQVRIVGKGAPGARTVDFRSE